jgi:hypothetical protein
MTINTSNLDFSDIKSKLKTYLRSSGEFEDYDFNASGLSNILDVLSYNTHINALIANLAINESFLTTSQIRASVIGHAEALGYSVKSRTAARATIRVELTIENPPATFTLNKGTMFLSSIDDIGYQFLTIEPYTVDISQDNTFIFENVQIVEGKMNKRTFFANDADNVSYVIQDENIDTSTISVKVKDNATSPNFVAYHDIQTVTTINDDSTIYMVNETPNGYYDITFSDGNVLGKRPVRGNVIEVSYISTNHLNGNGAQKFTPNDLDDVVVTTLSPSAGGSERESLNSIKLNAPRAYAAQNRLVTADDYRALIQARYSNYVRDVISWGGNDNLPPQYGKVFVSLNFRDNVSDEVIVTEKNNIRQELAANLSIMSIDLEFVDPQKTYLELQTKFNIDPFKVTQSQSLETDVKSLINAYVRNELNTFDATFRRSNLLTQIDNLSPAILNSRMTVRMQQRIDIQGLIEIKEKQLEDNGVLPEDFDTYYESDHVVNFPVYLAQPDKDDYTVTSSIFKSNGQYFVIKNKLGSTQLQMVDLNDVVKISNVGSYDPGLGQVKINSLLVDKDGFVGSDIKISATPANQSTVTPLRNYIITLDEEVSSVMSRIDTGEIKVTL